MSILTHQKKTTSLRIDNKLFNYIERRAKEENRSVNNYIETLLLNASGYIAPELTEEDFRALEKSKQEDEQGVYISSEEVHKKAIELCMK